MKSSRGFSAVRYTSRQNSAIISETKETGDGMEIEGLVKKQRAYFRTQATKDLEIRRNALKKLRSAIRDMEAEIHAAFSACISSGHLCLTSLYLTTFFSAIQNTSLSFTDLRL